MTADGETETRLIWHHDSLEYEVPFTPLRKTAGDEGMWDRWNLGRQPVTGNVVAEPSWWERYGVPTPTPTRALRDIADWDQEAGVWRLK